MFKILPLILSVVTLGVLLVSYLIKDVIREWVVIPLLELLQLVEFNQAIVWTAFLITLLIFTGFKIIQNFKEIPLESLLKRRRNKNFSKPRGGQLESIIEMIDCSNQGYYFQRRLAKQLSEITLEILSFQQKKSIEELTTLLKRERLQIPDWLQRYMTAALFFKPMRISSMDRWLFWRKRPASVFDIDPDDIVQFLESELDITSTPKALDGP